MKRLILILIIIAGSVVGVLSVSVRPENMKIVYTGETLGRLSPCICNGQMAGGLEFRNNYINKLATPFLLLDTGNVLSGGSADEIVVGKIIMDQMRRMGYSAVNIGRTELAAGAEYILANHDLLLSANVQITGSGSIKQYSIVETDGLKVAVSGVVFSGLCGKGVSFARADLALGNIISRMREKADYIVLLVDGTADQAKDLANDFPEVALILYKGAGESCAPYRVNQSYLSSVYGGRYIANMQVLFNDDDVGAAQGDFIELNRESCGVGDSSIRKFDGVSVEPSKIYFPSFDQGVVYKREFYITNNTGSSVSVGRVLSSCSCISLDLAQKVIPPGKSEKVVVQLKSLGLKGQQEFPLYLELKQGDTRGVAIVKASTISSGEGE